MELLQVKNEKIVTRSGMLVWLRGTCVGGWMNMEDFINGVPGTESSLRKHMVSVLGEENGKLFFDQMMDNFLCESDVRFISEMGANCVRLALNYRHFEDDSAPFAYKEEGFRRLDEMIAWCEKFGLYVILDMHAVQGWQNSHWHCDNERGASLFWTHKHFQDRLAALWQEIARRYRGKGVIAGYDLMNEPSSNTPNGDHAFDFYENFRPDWSGINGVYRRLVHDIRQADPEHIIFIEGDHYGSDFDGLEEPFADNLVYSSHNYTPPGIGPAPYPGHYGHPNAGFYWDRHKHYRQFMSDSGTAFARKHNVPLWVGEFGAQFHGPQEQVGYRLHSMDDQLSVLNQCGVHWTTWTYKDVGVMGWVTLNPESELMQIVKPVQHMKETLGAENYVVAFNGSPGREKANELANLILEVSKAPYNREDNAKALACAALYGYTAAMLQTVYALRFKGMNAADIRRVMQAYHFQNCIVNQRYAEILRHRLTEPAGRA